MAYVKIIFQNSPSTATPINAQNLNHMDDQIALNDQRLTDLEGAHVSSFNGRTGAVTPQNGDYDMGQITPTNGATVGQIPIVRNDGTAEDPNLTFHMEDVPSSGHVIKDQSGTSLAQEDALQFADAFLTDDSVNGRTVVENIKEVAPADYASTTDEGIIVCDDGNDVPIGEIEEDSDTITTATTVADVKDKIEEALANGQIPHIVCDLVDGSLTFKNCDLILTHCGYNTNVAFKFVAKPDNNTTFNVLIETSGTLSSGYTFTSGTLYYGTSSTVINLKTSADYCMMPDGETSVEDEINGLIDNTGVNALTFTNNSGRTISKQSIKRIGKLCIVSFAFASGSSAMTNIGTLNVKADGRHYATAYLTDGTNTAHRSVYIDNNSSTLAFTEFNVPNGYSITFEIVFVCK